MNHFLNFLTILGSKPFFLAIITLSLLIKGYLLGVLFTQGKNNHKKITLPWIFLIGVLAGSMVGDFAWFIKYFRLLIAPVIPYSFTVFTLRMGHAFLIIQYQSLALFTKSLTEKQFKLPWIQKIILSFGGLFFGYFTYSAFFDNSLTNEAERAVEMGKNMFLADTPFEKKMMGYIALYVLPLITLVCIYTLIKNAYSTRKPKILNKQIDILIKFFLFPFLILEFLIASHINLQASEFYTCTTVGLSTLLISFAIAYCIQKIMSLRFLNFGSHVKSDKKLNFINDFAELLEQLSNAKSIDDIAYVTKQFCKDALGIPLSKIWFYLRDSENIDTEYDPYKDKKSMILDFLNKHDEQMISFIRKHKIIIYDEIEFSHYYEQDLVRQQLVSFLDAIEADIFLPIYHEDKIVSCIIVERNALENRLYSNVNRDELIIFATYVGNIFNLLQSRNVEVLINQKKELEEELYHKHKEIKQYKESLYSFFHNDKQNEIGIILYKNRRFTFANQEAKDIVVINLNTQEGHPLTKSIKKIARQVEEYKVPKTTFALDKNGDTIVLTAVLHSEQNSVIITVCYPGVTDIIKKQIHLLKDPTQCDYLLYLETTQTGKLIDQLLPGSGETVLNFKISLLKAALSKKALLLDIPSDDLIPTVELLHHVSLREKLHIIKLNETTEDLPIAKSLFGMNPLLHKGNSEEGLLKKLNGKGTLFIQNIHYLDLKTQAMLAEYIKYGYFSPLYSEARITCNVRIICSTEADINNKIMEGTFSPHLFHELNQMSLSMPSLITLPQNELHALTDGFTKQAVKPDNFTNLLALTDKEKTKIVNSKPASLKQIKHKIQQILLHKSKDNNMYNETEFDPAYTVSDPTLVEASRLGKHALRDRKIMSTLWNKFQNQNKIALFLGVNRSSVNRRCKEYGLE